MSNAIGYVGEITESQTSNFNLTSEITELASQIIAPRKAINWSSTTCFFVLLFFFFVLQMVELFCQGDSRTITHRKVIISVSHKLSANLQCSLAVWCGKECVFENAGSVWECQGRFLVFFAGRNVFLKKACFGHVYIRLIKIKNEKPGGSTLLK